MDTAAASKRKRSDEPDADEEDGGDSVIGLNVGGQLFYTHKSTLTAGSTYFAARFGGSFSAGACRKDENGWNVYFIDADSDTFRYILSYLRRGVASWPDQANDPKFHKRLVAEAEYFGVEAMLEELCILASISPNESGKGILYWLGTKRGSVPYQNPLVAKEVTVTANLKDRGGEARHQIADFFGYRPACDNDALENFSMVLHCGLVDGKSRNFSFANIIVRPSHYSLRYGHCHGMSDWNFEASSDGENWDVLHKARKDQSILHLSDAEQASVADKEESDFISIAEENHRQTWPVESSSYYKHFRFCSLSNSEFRDLYDIDNDDMEDPVTLGDDGRVFFSRCLHGVGFELYGDVKDAK